MTHPSIHARSHPDKIAYRMAGGGKAISYRELGWPGIGERKRRRPWDGCARP